MMRTLLAVTALLLGSLLSPAFARRKPTPCPDARYVVTAGAERLASDAAPPVAINLETSGLTISGGCAPDRIRLKLRRRGHSLIGTWNICGALTKVRVKASFTPTCESISGTIRAKKTPAIPFTAALTRCGDAILDPTNAEACDGTACSDDQQCVACGCVTPGGGGCATIAVPTQAWTHVPVGSDLASNHNPPTSGPHYPIWARYQAFSEVIPRGFWVHDLEHGGAVIVYRPDADASVIAQLQSVYQSIPADPSCGHSRTVMTPDPLLERPFSVVAADHELQCDGVEAQAILDFITLRRGHGPEAVCLNGSYPPTP